MIYCREVSGDLVWCPRQNKRITLLSFFHGYRKRLLKIIFTPEMDCDHTAAIDKPIPAILSSFSGIADKEIILQHPLRSPMALWSMRLACDRAN
jgi:hypothetical protein